jgi:hypothetical protein
MIFQSCVGLGCTGSGFMKIYACHMMTHGSEQVNLKVS